MELHIVRFQVQLEIWTVRANSNALVGLKQRGKDMEIKVVSYKVDKVWYESSYAKSHFCFQSFMTIAFSI